MNIYFTAAISLKDKYGDYYLKIVDLLISNGHKVVHEHITKVSMKNISDSSIEERNSYYKKVQRWISEADLVVAELSFPSTLNIGYEISAAIERGKTVIGLYLKDCSSAFFQGISSDKFIYEEYTEKTLEYVLKNALELAQDTADVRFNFIISPSLLEYLDWIAKNKKLPRSVYLRRLIEEDMAKNKGYKA